LVLFFATGKILHLVALGIATIAAATATAAEEFAYDVVIRNGRLLDGLGNPWIRGDLAIKDGRIARIGRCDGRGRREIDARDRYVSPGWIDLMDQSGEVLQRNGLAENKLLQGVTSAIAGEGGTPVPAGEIDAYFSGLERSGISLNFGTYYSSAQARSLSWATAQVRRLRPRWRR
jgi:N-acyl-D-amino-acid deacylase